MQFSGLQHEPRILANPPVGLEQKAMCDHLSKLRLPHVCPWISAGPSLATLPH